MFSTNAIDHYQYYLTRQAELEAIAQNDRIIAMLPRKGSRLRKNFGSMLIALGEKLAQQPEKDIQLAFSLRQ